MNKSIFTKIFSLILFFLASFVPYVNGQVNKTGSAHHMLWKVKSDDGLQGFLVGSVHRLKPGIYPLDDVYQVAFKKSDVIVFEVNFDSMKVKALPLLRQLAFYQQGKTIKDVLSSDTYGKLKSAFSTLGLPFDRFQRMEPWRLNLVYTQIKIKRAGFSGKLGIDMHFFQKAQKYEKDVAALETVAYQLNIFDDLLPQLQVKILKTNLNQPKLAVQKIDEIVSLWKSGSTEELEYTIQQGMKSENPKFYQKALVERNKNWIPKIKNLLAAKEISMVVVGTKHMVGETGLVSLLEKQGYKVEQM